MKKQRINPSIAFTLFLILISGFAQGQVPQGIPYQAIARNAQGQPLANLPVKVRFSIIDSVVTGPAIYSETHEPTTSAQGLFNVNVGMGNSINGTFGYILWSADAKFMKVELDTTASGNNYIDLGTQQIMSVPYALHAINSDSWLVNQDSTSTRKWVSILSRSPQAPLYVHNGLPGEASVKFRNGFGTSKVLHVIEEQNSSGHYGVFVGAADYSDAVFVTKASRVGIKTMDPQRSLHVNDVIRLEPRSAAPSSPGMGDMYYDSTLNKLRVYDGTIWQNCW